MELWEFNNYQLGYRNYIKEKERDIIKVAYYTAAFSRSKKNKSLSSYLKQIDNSNKKINNNRNRKQLEFARKMDEKISKMSKKNK